MCDCLRGTAGSQHIPNSWTLEGPVDLQAQAETGIAACSMRWPRVTGFAAACCGAGRPALYSADAAASDRYYEFYNKPAESVIREAFAH
ncbi:hypothetical protein [Bifidobacterium thermacidophilum]|uniref:hypothetical protein n=1 Tax=Bifidobacterium thermacidophilum TaxID=246618 RepID=UPI003F01148F